MRHENGAGWERVSGGAQFSGVLKAVELVFDACFGGLTVAVRPSCWSKLRLGGTGGGIKLPGLGHNTTRNIKTAVSRRRLGETMASYPTPGICTDLDLYNGWHQRPGGIFAVLPQPVSPLTQSITLDIPPTSRHDSKSLENP